MMHWQRMALQPGTYKLKVKVTNQELALCSVHERRVHFIQIHMLAGDAGTEQAWSQHRQVCRTYTMTALCYNECVRVLAHIARLSLPLEIA